MKGGFNDRVDKVFGSISSSSSSWSLTDAPVEKREWNHRRDTENDRDDDQIPVFFSSSSSDTENIRSSIGLDPTLDHEEEEDAYDKMAQGTEEEEDCSHRLYMKDVDDHGPFLNSHNLLPKSIHHHPPPAADDKKTSLNDAAAEEAPSSEDNNNGFLRIKSILKKRKTCDVDDDDHELAKPIASAKCKRVRFDSTCKNVVDDPPHPEPTLVVSQNRPAVPDYILNPSKYTRYTFDDGSCNPSDFLEESSSKHSTAAAALECGELPKVVFIPRKKRGDNNNEDEHVRKQSSTIDIAAVEVQHQEDEEESHDVDDNVCTKTRPVRQYRSKIDDYDDDAF